MWKYEKALEAHQLEIDELSPDTQALIESFEALELQAEDIEDTTDSADESDQADATRKLAAINAKIKAVDEKITNLIEQEAQEYGDDDEAEQAINPKSPKQTIIEGIIQKGQKTTSVSELKTLGYDVSELVKYGSDSAGPHKLTKPIFSKIVSIR